MAGALALAACCAGCLFGQSTDVKRTGVDVPEATFGQITPGQTTGGWVRATLGEPTAKTVAGPGDEVWRYDYTERTDSSGYVFLIFGGSNTTETKRQAVVEVKDGVVVRKWRS
jgi:outer membrane protein assembly factor BamE (lipoprotein component of BamABCDE complex)